MNRLHLVSLVLGFFFGCTDGCGETIAGLDGRIIGGLNATYGQIPFQAVITETKMGIFTSSKCGGVIIDNEWILTAAHCQRGWFGSLKVIVGQYHINSKNSRVVREVQEMIVHPYFSYYTLANDIALIKLNKPLEFNTNVQPICLPDSDDEFHNRYGTVSGWGTMTAGTSNPPRSLQYTRVPIMTNKECEEMFAKTRYRRRIYQSMICAGYPEGGKDSCSGDSGGPLMVREYNRWILVGIVSHGVRCGEPNLPGIYTNVAQFVDWIHSKFSEHESLNRFTKLIKGD